MIDLIDQLKIDEGFRAKVYHCTAGKLTIGYGYNLDANCLNLNAKTIIRYKEEGITESEAENILFKCVVICTHECDKSLDWFSPLSRKRQDAIVNMVFNIGIKSFMGFHNAIACIKKQDWQGASKHLLNSKWAKQVGSRAQRIAKVIREG